MLVHTRRHTSPQGLLALDELKNLPLTSPGLVLMPAVTLRRSPEWVSLDPAPCLPEKAPTGGHPEDLQPIH